MPTRPELPIADSANDQVIQEVFDQTPLISIAKIPDYVATGSSSGRPRLQWRSNRDTLVPSTDGPPIAALIVRAVEFGDETGNPGNIRPALNFEYDSVTGDVVLFEPLGLRSGTRYSLTVMFLAKQGR